VFYCVFMVLWVEVGIRAMKIDIIR
jgi:hypothetical protein